MSKAKPSKPLKPLNPRRPSRFRALEVARAIRAAKAAGGERVEIDPATGRISVIVGKGGEEGGSNPWDEVLTGTAGQNRPT